ncbi:MAG: hypothetical protein VKP70_07125 [Cyanobacteriota bacterium]|nr:hypothetical protein [Cyanobacteriota bacterium]
MAMGVLTVSFREVEGNATEVQVISRGALAGTLTAPHQASSAPGARHLFEETGVLEAVASLANDWFGNHLCASSRP